MTVWRMAMRCGSGGPDMWPLCVERGVAAITYSPLDTVDLANFPEGEPKELWKQLASSQKASLRRVAYEMKKGDIIYVKHGGTIVGRGTVRGPYQFDHTMKLLDLRDHGPWAHQVPVDWDKKFVPVEILLGAEQLAVRELTGDSLQALERAIGESIDSEKERERQLEVLEGKRYKAEATFRKRNRALIEAKKLASNGKCEICEFHFADYYVGLKRDCLVAHHVKPIGKRKGETKTRIEDICLICPNCHAVVHTQDPPIPPSKVRRMLQEG